MFCSTQVENSISNTGGVQFEGLVQLFLYIRDNKNLGLRYYANIECTPLSDLLRQAIINTKKKMVVLSYSICQDCSDTGSITGSCIVFYKGGPMNHCTHVPGTVDK